MTSRHSLPACPRAARAERRALASHARASQALALRAGAARLARIALAAAFLPGALALAAPPQASATEPAWVALTAGVPEGTPADVAIVAASSGEQGTTVEVTIHGYWTQQVLAPDGTAYQRIRVPGLPSTSQVGAPEVPVVRFALAVPTTADEVTLAAVDVTAQTEVQGTLLYPAPIPGSDEEIDPTGDPGEGAEEASDDEFAIDDAIYATSAAWPPGAGLDSAPVDAFYGHVPMALCEVHPISYNPVSRKLEIATHAYYGFAHGGAVQAFGKASKKKLQAAGELLLNWPAVEFDFPADAAEYHARYLIVSPAVFTPFLGGFVDHKKTLGYDCEVRVPAALTYAGVKATIDGWYAEGSSGMDHFVLLIGDGDDIPLLQLPTLGKTDDAYGSVNGGFLKAMHVGRLSIDSEFGLMNQLQKIRDYETSPVAGGHYGDVLMVAHDQGAPGKYQQAHQTVMDASYTLPPNFLQAFGSFGVPNSLITGVIEDGVGLVAYRGHGSQYAWTKWNTQDEYWHKNDVALLSNPLVPIVWSVACTNSDLDAGTGDEDSIGEVWLEASAAGAVAHYGATGTTGTSFNHLLDKELFRMAFDAGMLTHGIALDSAELQLWIQGWTGKNVWRYLLLGDPSMTIRHTTAAMLHVDAPLFLQSSDGDGSTSDLTLKAVDANGMPLPGALVSVYKPSLYPGKPDEVLAAAWADDVGVVQITKELHTPGPLHLAAQDGNGNVWIGEIPVGMSAAWQDLGGGAPGKYGVPHLWALGPLTSTSVLDLVVTGARENAACYLVLGFSQVNAPFKGGVMVPNPQYILPGLNTSADGHFEIHSPWTSGLPSGFEFFLQVWISDPDGPVGVAGTNGIKGTQP